MNFFKISFILFSFFFSNLSLSLVFPQETTKCNASNYKDYIFNPDKINQMLEESRINYSVQNWCDLRGVDFSGENLQGAKLFYLDLSYIKCEGSNFDGADFTRSNLSFANCKGASFKAANFHETQVSGANFSKTIWDNNSIVDTMYTEGLYNSANFKNAIGFPKPKAHNPL